MLNPKFLYIRKVQKIASIVYYTEAISRMNCKFQILNYFFYQVVPPHYISPFTCARNLLFPERFYLAQLLVFVFLSDLNLIFRSRAFWKKIMNNLLKIILLWRNYTGFQIYKLKLHCTDLFTFFRSNDHMRISENHFPWNFVKIIEKKLVNSLTYNFTKSFQKDFLEKFPNSKNSYLLKHL